MITKEIRVAKRTFYHDLLEQNRNKILKNLGHHKRSDRH
jgi:hypothetical protein